jgi:hypothetical protein
MIDSGIHAGLLGMGSHLIMVAGSFGTSLDSDILDAKAEVAASVKLSFRMNKAPLRWACS